MQAEAIEAANLPQALRAELVPVLEALEIDAEALPMFRHDADGPSAEARDVARALEMEQEGLLREDLDRCDIQQGGKAVRSP
ncbi:MAG: hypothetical protein ACKO45_01860 [Cyanobium sp.]